DSQNLASINVHDAGIHADNGLGLLASKAAQPESAQSTASAADVGVLGVVAELSDAADNDGVHAQQFADFGGARRIGAVAGGEILFRQNFVQGLALDHGISAVLDEALHQQIGDAFADVNVLPEQGCHAAVHGAVVKIEDGDALLAVGGMRRQAEHQQHDQQVGEFFHDWPPLALGQSPAALALAAAQRTGTRSADVWL